MLSRLLNPITRITFGLVSLAVSLILLSTLLGVFPDQKSETAQKRELIAESIAVNFSTMASSVDSETMENNLEALAERWPSLSSIGVRESDGFLTMEIGKHSGNWKESVGNQSTADQITIPIYGEETDWGQLEFRFKQTSQAGIWEFLSRPEIFLSSLFAVFGFVSFYLYLRFVLRQLDPSRVVPQRVKDALDTLAEGLIVVNKNQEIVLANQSFQTIAQKDETELIGKIAKNITNEAMNLGTDGLDTPWEQALEGETVRGHLITGEYNGDRAAFLVSSSPIIDDKGVNRGAIASFEDVTQLERKKVELETMLIELDASSSEIKRQNSELAFLATRDPMTGCLNRRAFFDRFDQLFENAQRHELPIASFMVDIDKFKSINDNHGHATGDAVLIAVASLLQEKVREKDIVCRYGGEEFSILLPNTTIHQACVVAEQIRTAIETLNPAGLELTTSIGVSALSEAPESPEDMLDQADKCLYVAKRNGRNQVVRWDDVPNDIEIDESQVSRLPEESSVAKRDRIPFHAVTALISALAFRDQDTANHCRRVADLCVAVSEGLLSAKDSYILEIAGLLHDIGKIGVADTILLKSDKLTEAERATMRKHQRFGVELVHTSFGCDILDNIVANYQVTHDQRISEKLNVPLGARILAIADAFDSMTHDQAYRSALTRKQAFAELRKFAGTQFDPELVERFIQVVKTNNFQKVDFSDKISKQAALGIGLQIERLAEALDSRDKEGIGNIASRLTETATKHGIVAVADKANEITREIELDGELYDLIRCTIELMDLCRYAQRSMIKIPSSESISH